MDSIKTNVPKQRQTLIARYGLYIVPLLSIFYGACLEGSGPESFEIVHLSPLEQDTFSPTEILDPGPPGNPKDIEQYKKLFEGVETNAQALFDKPGITQQLDLIERAYISAGRYQDLMAMYAKHVQANGAKSRVADRYAWALVKLGQDKQARELCASLVQQQPQNPTFWFVYGAYWLRYANTSNEGAKKLIVSWQEVLKLNPSFSSFDGINASVITKEVTQQRTRLRPSRADLDAVRQQIINKPKNPIPPVPKSPKDAPKPEPKLKP